MSDELLEQVYTELRAALQAQGTPEGVAAAQRYSKEPVQAYGLSVPQVRAIAKTFLPRLKKEASLEDMIDLCDLLLETEGLEEGGAVDVLMSPFAKKLTPMHYPYVDRWVDYFTNWAVTDAICLHVIGVLVERHQMLLPFVASWTESDNRWRRRAACVSLVPAARHNTIPISSVFSLTDHLMHDKDDMVQKGTGWLLKVAAEHHQQRVVENLQAFPDAGRTLVRYAIEKLPPETRALFVGPRARAKVS